MARLGDVCKIYTGTGFPNQYQGETSGDYPFYKVGDISRNVSKGNVYLQECDNYISADTAKKIKGTIVPIDTVVFAKIGEAVKLNRRAITSQNCLVDNNAMGICPDQQKLNLSYFFHYMCSIKLEAYAEATTVPSVKKSVIENIDIPLPTYAEQVAISEVIDKVSSLISLRKQQLAKLDELVKARFVELFGDMLLNPRGWSETRLDTIADIVSGITKGRKVKTSDLMEVPYMAVSNVKDGYIDWTTVKTIMATQAEIEQYRLLPYDVLMTEGGDPDKLGRGAIIHEPPENCIHQNHIFRVRLDQTQIIPEFMEQYLKQQKAKRYFLGCAKQTTGIASINMTQLKALPVLIPPIELQNEYKLFAEQTDKSKLAIQQSLDKLETLKKSLMQKYFG